MLRGDPEGLDTTSFAAFRIRFLISEHIGLGWVDFIFLHRFRHHERRRLTAFAMFFRNVRASIEIVQYNSMFFQLLGECLVELFGVLQCKVATSNTGLVRDDNQQITQFLKMRSASATPGNNSSSWVL